MSLLLQALQKASKNRNEGEEPGPDPLDSEELTLEPMGRPEPALQREREAETPVSPVSSTPAQAAALMQARRAPAFDPMEYAREHYMIVFVAGAFLAAAAYGAYVYIQVSNPAWLRSTPAAASARPLPPPPAAGTAQGPSPESPSAKLSGLPEDVPASPGAVTTPAQAPVSPPALPAAPPTDVASIPAPPAQTAAPARPAGSRLKLERVQQVESQVDEDGVETVVLRPAPRAARTEAKSVPPAPEAAPAVAPDIARAYEALQAGDVAQARTLYAEFLRDNPKNIDALLGSATIASNEEGRTDEAVQFYQRVLELEPRNAYAQAGLISMLGGADPTASESRLRQLISREPSAFLYFTLGNLYADQGQWPAAQQAYFQAYQSQPDNPDYAFNLAVGLEHLGQTRQALDYYRKALDLSFRKGRANFDQGLVIQRVGQLSSRVEQ